MLGFEDPALWQVITGNAQLSSSSTHTQGASSLQARLSNFVELTILGGEHKGEGHNETSHETSARRWRDTRSMTGGFMSYIHRNLVQHFAKWGDEMCNAMLYVQVPAPAAAPGSGLPRRGNT